MALLREHFFFGLTVGGVIYLVLFAIAFYFHVFQGFWALLISLVLGFLFMVVGSLLPDMDAPRSPVHDVLMVFFGSLMSLIFRQLVLLPLVMSVVPILTVWADRNYMPGHRTTIHTIEAAFLFGLMVTGGIYFFIWINIVFALWCGFSLAVGHLIHLVKDDSIGHEN